MITEWEWRKQAEQKRRRRPQSWGAQYFIPRRMNFRLHRARGFHAFLLLLSFVISALLPLSVRPVAQETFAEAIVQETAQQVRPREIREVTYAFPDELERVVHTYTRYELLRGRMLLIDESHPLPENLPAPNTVSIAGYGMGQVPVRDLQVKSGRETIEALIPLFAVLRKLDATGLCVWEGTQSLAQQLALQENSMRTLMQSCSIEEARNKTLALYDEPGTGELLQQYTVEIRHRTQENASQWQTLMQQAWRYGFVQTQPEGRHPYRFRWVGRAHATAMTYLALEFEDYLNWLHEVGVLVVHQDGKPKYMILCRRMDGDRITFSVPANAICEASLDNMGYAIVACTLGE